ncbi:hypothetical protein [Gloeocapsa sp. PCC 73106]|uniref:hypothetical protein n=1 Tax=Gloeocapsa sp. PCC 73106 TaxID=102232 RepID=UPI0002AC68EE|nr:hypothetical protein [Gloeocapsa sp. PCC 73106]ELR98460.1 hypothetical protein GLO73106DRAFT_00022930 [Gloeocapsa sp. PCC 73106]
MKTIAKWWIVGTSQTLLSVALVLGAPSVINSGRPMLGFTMFGLAGTCTGLIMCGACQNLLSSIKAKTILIESFPQRNDWSSLPVTAFLDISPQQVQEARSSLMQIVQDPWEADLVSGENVIYYIRTFSMTESDA